MVKQTIPNLGYGLGFCPSHFQYLRQSAPDVDWLAIETEGYINLDERAKRHISYLTERAPVLMRGGAMSIGTLSPKRSAYLTHLKRLERVVNPVFVVDSLCWTGIDGTYIYEPLPIPYTEEALKHLSEAICQTQDYLGRRLVFENPCHLIELAGSTMTECTFISRLISDTGCSIALNLKNLYINCCNHGWDVRRYLDMIPLQDVAYVNISFDYDLRDLNTDINVMMDDVWAIYADIIRRNGGPINTMTEWNAHIEEKQDACHRLNKAQAYGEKAQDQKEICLPDFERPKYKTSLYQAPLPYQKELRTLQAAIIDNRPGLVTVPHQERAVPTPHLSVTDQIALYRKKYKERLREHMRRTYPVFAKAIGVDAFSALIEGYIRTHIPTEYNIKRYCERFPAYIKPHVEPFFYELAVLETTIMRVSDGRETPVLSQSDLIGLLPEHFLDKHLYPRSALRLLSFQYPVNAFYEQSRHGERPPQPERYPSYLVVYRHADEVWRLDLEESEYLVLASLFSGATVGESLNSIMPESEIANDDMSGVGLWFSRWINNGLLAKAI